MGVTGTTILDTGVICSKAAVLVDGAVEATSTLSVGLTSTLAGETKIGGNPDRGYGNTGDGVTITNNGIICIDGNLRIDGDIDVQGATTLTGYVLPTACSHDSSTG